MNRYIALTDDSVMQVKETLEQLLKEFSGNKYRMLQVHTVDKNREVFVNKDHIVMVTEDI